MTNIIITGLIMGSIYALISMGLSLQYGVAKILNVTHGEFIMVAAFLTWAMVGVGINPLLALVICCLGDARCRVCPAHHDLPVAEKILTGGVRI